MASIRILTSNRKAKNLRIHSLEEMKFGWFIGNFNPSIFKTAEFEVGIKKFSKGQKEVSHFQKVATEWTCVISGRIRLGQHTFTENQIIEIKPFEELDFEALTDCILVVVKSPSIPEDKFLSSNAN